MAEGDLELVAVGMAFESGDHGLDDAESGAPGDVPTGDRVAGPEETALGPVDQREELDAASVSQSKINSVERST